MKKKYFKWWLSLCLVIPFVSYASTDPMLDSLLVQAKKALAKTHFLQPEEDNANLYYQIILGRDPTHQEAREGLAIMVSYYTDWAWQQAQRQNYEAAKRHLASARLINPDDPLITQTQQAVDKLRQQRGKVVTPTSAIKLNPNQYLLPANLFAKSDDEVLALLQPIIDRVAKERALIEIYWPTDKEASLLYRIINSRVQDFRVRAMIYHRQQHMIDVKQQ